MTQSDLFAEPLIAGLDYREDFISRDEEAALLRQLEGREVIGADPEFGDD